MDRSAPAGDRPGPVGTGVGLFDPHAGHVDDSRGNTVSVSGGYLDYVLDQLQELGEVAPKRMFGGVGLYFDGLFFALIAGDVLYFKVDDSNRPDYEAAGMDPFRPFGRASYAMRYYEVPAGVLEDRESLRRWAEKSLAAARRKSSRKR